MLNGMREVLERTHGDAFLRRILGITIALGLVRYDDLRVALCPKGTTFKERFSVPDTSVVNMESCFDIVDSVNDAILGIPEVVVKDWFVLKVDTILLGFNVELFVHQLYLTGCSCAFATLDIITSEQELSVEV